MKSPYQWKLTSYLYVIRSNDIPIDFAEDLDF